eukprot:TRINITY_DN49064_c0_g1_i1.p1 TRINITY_DN49064_c0_g1~~TRINITY_DN49064_c0_g1_i1.p1  ORF type:complete len:403 (-),score=202.67 TRINITY_DN49064_c0_g1_i1:250-1458(-)
MKTNSLRWTAVALAVAVLISAAMVPGAEALQSKGSSGGKRSGGQSSGRESSGSGEAEMSFSEFSSTSDATAHDAQLEDEVKHMSSGEAAELNGNDPTTHESAGAALGLSEESSSGEGESTVDATQPMHAEQQRQTLQQQATPAACRHPSPHTAMCGFLTHVGRFEVENLDPYEEWRRAGSRQPQGVRRRVRHKPERLPALIRHRSTVNKFLIHTTEGTPNSYAKAIGTLDKKRYWPHFVIGRDPEGRMRVGQFLPLNYAARALSANNAFGMIQVEVCTKAVNVFTNDPEFTEAVRALYGALHVRSNGVIPLHKDPLIRFVSPSEHHQITRQSRRRRSDVQPVRLQTLAQLRQLSGVLGHQHAPGERHVDPGAIDVARLMSATPAQTASDDPEHHERQQQQQR